MKITHTDCNDRPNHLKAPHYVHVWAMEREWHQLRLARPSLSEQCRIFTVFVKGILACSHEPWQIPTLPCLKCLNVARSVAALSWRPSATFSNSPLVKFQMRSGHSFHSFLQARFNGFSDQFLRVCARPRDVCLEYNQYKSHRRA